MIRKRWREATADGKNQRLEPRGRVCKSQPRGEGWRASRLETRIVYLKAGCAKHVKDFHYCCRQHCLHEKRVQVLGDEYLEAWQVSGEIEGLDKLCARQFVQHGDKPDLAPHEVMDCRPPGLARQGYHGPKPKRKATLEERDYFKGLAKADKEEAAARHEEEHGPGSVWECWVARFADANGLWPWESVRGLLLERLDPLEVARAVRGVFPHGPPLWVDAGQMEALRAKLMG